MPGEPFSNKTGSKMLIVCAQLAELVHRAQTLRSSSVTAKLKTSCCLSQTTQSTTLVTSASATSRRTIPTWTCTSLAVWEEQIRCWLAQWAELSVLGTHWLCWEAITGNYKMGNKLRLVCHLSVHSAASGSITVFLLVKTESRNDATQSGCLISLQVTHGVQLQDTKHGANMLNTQCK